MTRKMIFRTLVAMLLLPNFTAYWWMLPRRMKRIRTQRDLMWYLIGTLQRRTWERSFERALAIKEGRIATIGVGEFRIPFQVRSDETGWHTL